MATSIQAAFDQYFEKINLPGDHRVISNERKEHIVSLLKNKFEILDSLGSGSIPRFTALKGKSDLDVMVVLHYGKHIEGKTPTQVLQSVRDALAEHKNQVRKNGQAVTLHYKTWPNVDIVPVSRVSQDGVFLYYNVPDANTEKWIESNPKVHSDNMESKVKMCGINYRKIIKFMKAWNISHGDYLQSYHIEAMAHRSLNSALDDLPWHMFQFFKSCRELASSPLWYERGFADDYLSYSDREEIKKRLTTAEEKSRAAWWHGTNNEIKKSIEAWRQVFGSEFPSYG